MMSDLCRKWLAVTLVCSLLGACSITLMPMQRKDTSHRPSSAPPVVDTVIASTAAVMAFATSQSSCHGDELCTGLRTETSIALGVLALPFALSALYGYARLSDEQKAAPPAPLAQQQITAPGMTLTCQQRRDAQLALARRAAEEQGQAIRVRDLPDCE
jgi:hypothetical protein